MVLLQKRSKAAVPEPERWVDGDLACEVHRQALLLTTALNGLRLEEGEFDHKQWVRTVEPWGAQHATLDGREDDRG